MVTSSSSNYLLESVKYSPSTGIALRSVEPINDCNEILVSIPGGPGIGSSYFDEFLLGFHHQHNLNTAVLDLPNHGLSLDNPGLSFPNVLEFLSTALEECIGFDTSVVLFGQSLGARLAFDLIDKTDSKVVGCCLTSFPYTFSISSKLRSQIGAIDEKFMGRLSSDRLFAEYWREILPFYMVNQAGMDNLEIFKGIRWVGNERFLVDVPDLSGPLRSCDSLPILILKGEDDPVLPDGNWDDLETAIPFAKFVSIPKTGHFAILENPERCMDEFIKFIQEESLFE